MGKFIWILEVIRKLNAEVIGQAIPDRELFPLDNPDVRIEGLEVIVEESTNCSRKSAVLWAFRFSKYKLAHFNHLIDCFLVLTDFMADVWGCEKQNIKR